MVRLGLVVSQYNKEAPVTHRMAESAHEAATARDAEIVDTIEVPGVYETPLAADRLARREDIQAVAVLGAIITGDTDHDQAIGHAAAQRISEISVDRDTPVTLGITGPGQSAAEAEERTDKGAEAVDSAIDMVEALA
jgi:6,7-dimethyl-8-ribityllumazine synthase